MIKIAFSERLKDFPLEDLKKWFVENKRSFPWRDNPSPYYVWVSEVMLQQTRAEVVVKYFLNWMDLFPTIEALAKAKEEEVIKTWEGLGYYTRARNLLEGARLVMENFGGNLPSDPVELKKIKGLGPYTIHAILAFAFKQRTAAVDGNVLRVMSRVFLIEASIDLESTKTWISRIVQIILPKKDPQLVAEALIELGACICKRAPLCEKCPLRSICGAYQKGEQRSLPIRHERKKIITLFRWVAVIIYGDSIVLEQRKPEEIMAGLYEFPYIEVNTSQDLLDTEALIGQMENLTGASLTLCGDFAEQKQSFTHYRVRLVPKILKALSLPKLCSLYPISSIDSLPFSSGHRKIKNLILENLHNYESLLISEVCSHDA
ncbi:A/G-specific adenine glycosylase [Chlamydia ibidis]|uniref:Adenine DNA glycosylase n=2 Tax=Chlamydia ibidis TaxID=1405396 RepID=S7J5H5_9CHLA|nr:A/G-specific adenine glycosylase [Chlamydia ibidis]EPP35659.1 A/G-specific adenine glycosylase [Chlamydia ibidis]EQM62700.1 A/G-specific adenine glycosylase [Chlamydia ibidis 10-1398/6]